MYAIWNLTKVCPWDCSFCCMSAIKVGQVNGGESLNSSEKIKVLEILATHKMKIDFSGGDPLYNPEDFAIVERAVEIMPRTSSPCGGKTSTNTGSPPRQGCSSSATVAPSSSTIACSCAKLRFSERRYSDASSSGWQNRRLPP